jgi:hypothetical protein
LMRVGAPSLVQLGLQDQGQLARVMYIET